MKRLDGKEELNAEAGGWAGGGCRAASARPAYNHCCSSAALRGLNKASEPLQS